MRGKHFSYIFLYCFLFNYTYITFATTQEEETFQVFPSCSNPFCVKTPNPLRKTPFY